MRQHLTKLMAILLLVSNVSARSLQIPALNLSNILNFNQKAIVYELNTAVPVAYESVHNAVMLTDAVLQMGADVAEARIAAVGGAAELAVRAVGKVLNSVADTADIGKLVQDTEEFAQMIDAGTRYGYETVHSLAAGLEKGIERVFKNSIIKTKGAEYTLEEMLIPGVYYKEHSIHGGMALHTQELKNNSVLAYGVDRLLDIAVDQLANPVNFREYDYENDQGGIVSKYIFNALCSIFDRDNSKPSGGGESAESAESAEGAAEEAPAEETPAVEEVPAEETPAVEEVPAEAVEAAAVEAVEEMVAANK